MCHRYRAPPSWGSLLICACHESQFRIAIPQKDYYSWWSTSLPIVRKDRVLRAPPTWYSTGREQGEGKSNAKGGRAVWAQRSPL